jgi:hypothetical protein
MIDTSKYVFPIAGGKFIDNIKDIYVYYGSCFYLGDDIFITAGHVLKNAQENECKALGYLKEGHYLYRDFKDYEIIEKPDIGILKVKVEDLSLLKFKWSSAPRGMLREVYTLGYAHGLEISESDVKVNFRAFRGYIVSRSFVPLNYELSFYCPKGISGAPLLEINTNEVIGVILGNSLINSGDTILN